AVGDGSSVVLAHPVDGDRGGDANAAGLVARIVAGCLARPAGAGRIAGRIAGLRQGPVGLAGGVRVVADLVLALVVGLLAAVVVLLLAGRTRLGGGVARQRRGRSDRDRSGGKVAGDRGRGVRLGDVDRDRGADGDVVGLRIGVRGELSVLHLGRLNRGTARNGQRAAAEDTAQPRRGRIRNNGDRNRRADGDAAGGTGLVRRRHPVVGRRGDHQRAAAAEDRAVLDLRPRFVRVEDVERDRGADAHLAPLGRRLG